MEFGSGNLIENKSELLGWCHLTSGKYKFYVIFCVFWIAPEWQRIDSMNEFDFFENWRKSGILLAKMLKCYAKRVKNKLNGFCPWETSFNS